MLNTHEYLELKVIRRLRHTHFSICEHHVPNPPMRWSIWGDRRISIVAQLRNTTKQNNTKQCEARLGEIIIAA